MILLSFYSEQTFSTPLELPETIAKSVLRARGVKDCVVKKQIKFPFQGIFLGKPYCQQLSVS